MKWSFICSGLLMCLVSPAHAQGLIWSLPKDGEWIRYEGTYSEEIKRPDSPAGDLKLEWRRITTIKSVGVEQAEYRGEQQACRWIEIKSETGKAAEAIVETGPGGTRTYKILVPESAIQGKINEIAADDRPIHIAFIPVVKGYRRIDTKDVEPIEAGVFQIYPVVSLLRHYNEFTETGDAKTLQVPAGSYESTQHDGEMVMETPTERSTNTCELQRSEKAPFGIVSWTAKSVIESKGSTDDRSDFKEALTILETMQAAAVGDGAESELSSK